MSLIFVEIFSDRKGFFENFCQTQLRAQEKLYEIETQAQNSVLISSIPWSIVMNGKTMHTL